MLKENDSPPSHGSDRVGLNVLKWCGIRRIAPMLNAAPEPRNDERTVQEPRRTL